MSCGSWSDVQTLMSCRRSCAAEVYVVQTLLRLLQKLLSCRSLCGADVAETVAEVAELQKLMKTRLAAQKENNAYFKQPLIKYRGRQVSVSAPVKSSESNCN